MSHVNRSAATIRKAALVFIVVGMSVLSAATLAGQGPFAPATGPIDLILQKLVAIQEALTSLATPPPEPSEVTLRTSPAPIISGADTFVECNFANVSARTILVDRRLVAADGTNASVPSTVGVAPGRSTKVGSNATQGLRRCEFRFSGFA